MRKCASNLKYGSYDERDCNAIYKIFCHVTHDKIECYNYIEICNTLYEIGTFIVTNMKKSEIEFGEIIKIVKVNDDIYFHMKVFKEITFDNYWHAFIVHQENNETKYTNQKNVPNIAPCLSIKRQNGHFVARRYGL